MRVTTDGENLVSHAGTALLAELADQAHPARHALAPVRAASGSRFGHFRAMYLDRHSRTNGTRVDCFDGIVVGGGRAILPFPRGAYDDTDPTRPQLLHWEVAEGDVALWRLVHSMRGRIEQFDRHLEQSGFVVVTSRNTSL